MKEFLIIAGLVLATTLGYSQGTVNFQNKVSTASIDAPITENGVKIDGATHPNAFAALYAGPAGASEFQLVLIGPIVGFRTGTAAGYVNVGSSASRSIDSVLPGGVATVQIRVWDGATSFASYEAALASGSSCAGKSALLQIVTGGAGSPPGPAANLLGLSPFAIDALGPPCVPEPSTLALAAMSAFGLLALRRRKRAYYSR
jgi:PEP-CTERM motif